MPRRTTLTFAILIAILSSASVTRAADEAIDHLSEDAFMAIRFASHDQYVGNFTDLLTGIGQLALDTVGPEVEDGLNDFAFLAKGADVFDPKTPICGGLYPIENGGTPVAIFCKIKGDVDDLYRAMLRADADDKIKIEKLDDGVIAVSREKRSRKYYVTTRGGLTVYTRNELVMKKLIDDQKAKKPSYRSAIGKEAAAEFFAGDVSICFNMPTGVKAFKDDMERARNEIKEGIKNIPDTKLASPSASSLKAVLTAGVDLLFQGIYDTEVAVGRANFSSQGAAGGITVTFKDGSATDAIMRFNPPSDLANLELLPFEESAYTAVNLNFGQWTKHFINMSAGEVASNKATDEAIESLHEGFQSLVSSFSLGNKRHDGILVTIIEETAKVGPYRAAWKTIIDGIADTELTPFMTQSMKYASAAETVQGKKVDLLSVNFNVKPDSAEGQIVSVMLNQVLGGTQIDTRITAVEDLLVQVVSNDSKELGKQLDRFESGEELLGLEDSYAATRDKLDEEANVVFLVNGARTVVDVLDLLRKTPIGQFLAQAPINFNVKPPKSYAGVSLKCSPRRLALKAYVPVSQPRDIMKIFVPGL